MATESESKSIMLANDFNAPHSFLYLHPSENPILSLVSPVLESQNYHSWSKSFATALSAKNKMQFIELTHVSGLEEMQQYGCLLVNTLSFTLHQAKYLMDGKTKEIWKDLKSRFSQGNLLRIYEL